MRKRRAARGEPAQGDVVDRDEVLRHVREQLADAEKRLRTLARSGLIGIAKDGKDVREEIMRVLQETRADAMFGCTVGEGRLTQEEVGAVAGVVKGRASDLVRQGRAQHEARAAARARGEEA